MRDIRADLRERIELAEATAKSAQDQAAMYRSMLEAEEVRMAIAGRSGTPNATSAVMVGYGNQGAPNAIRIIEEARNGGRSLAAHAAVTKSESLDDYLVRAVRRGVHEKDELRDAAVREGYFNGSVQSPGRVVHAKLTNLVRSGALAYEDEDKGDRFKIAG